MKQYDLIIFMNSPLSIVFFGTPQIACPVLEALIKHSDINVTAVITQNDKPVGRKKVLTAPPVKILAQKFKIPVFQTENLRKDQNLKKILKDLNPHFFVVLAFGQILDSDTLNIPQIAPLNIHGSILPKYRGASPIEEAILNGDTESGISFMRMTKKMDAGDIFDIIKMPITENDTSLSLRSKMGQLASENISKILFKIFNKQLTPHKQNKQYASYCHKITKEDGLINPLHETQEQIVNKFRAYTPWPGIYLCIGNKKISIINVEKSKQSLEPGEFNLTDGLHLGTKKGSIKIIELQPEGKKMMSAADFLRGNSALLLASNSNHANQ